MLLCLGLVVPAWTEGLLPAARANDLAKVKAALAQGSDPNELGDDQMAALSHAVRLNNLDMARVLLEAGARPNTLYVADAYGSPDTVLVRASVEGRTEMVDLLVSFGARTSALDAYYRSAFAGAFWSGDLVGARDLVERRNVRVQVSLDWLVAYEGGTEAQRSVLRLAAPELADPARSVLREIVSWIGGPEESVIGNLPGFPLSTSFLADTQRPDRYTARMALDGQMSTSWVEGREDDGIGEMIAFSVPPGATTVSIVPGYGDLVYYGQNNRVKTARLRVCVLQAAPGQFANGVTAALLGESTLSFVDAMRAQGFSLNLPSPLPSEIYVPDRGDELFAVLEILEVYPGSQWKDTCIAEIRVR
jgi:hypothetical protein